MGDVVSIFALLLYCAIGCFIYGFIHEQMGDSCLWVVYMLLWPFVLIACSLILFVEAIIDLGGTTKRRLRNRR